MGEKAQNLRRGKKFLKPGGRQVKSPAWTHVGRNDCEGRRAKIALSSFHDFPKDRASSATDECDAEADTREDREFHVLEGLQQWRAGVQDAAHEG
jgi:hypothetical protein